MEAPGSDFVLRPAAFVGRAAELRRIRTLIDESSRGRFQALLISGEPGIGKSRLAEQACDLAGSRDAVVCRARLDECGNYPDYWVWWQLLGGLSRDSAGRLDGNLPVSPRAIRSRIARHEDSHRSGRGRMRLCDSIEGLLERVASRSFLVLAVDNLHLAGTGSLQLFSALLDSLRTTRTLLIATYRSLPVDLTPRFSAFLASLRGVRNVSFHTMAGICEEAVGRLAGQFLGRTPDRQLVDELRRSTRGNPLLVAEAARLLARSGAFDGAMDGEIWTNELLQPFFAVIAPRFDLLSSDCGRLLCRAAVVGEEFSMAEVVSIAEGLREDRLAELLEEGRRSGFLDERTTGSEYRFSHDLVRRALRLRLAGGERRRTALRLARETEKRGDPRDENCALRMAGWYEFAEGRPARGGYRRCTHMAAESALESGDCEMAAELYGRLVDVGRRAISTESEAQALVGLARACYMKGDRLAAADHSCRAFRYFQKRGDLARMIDAATLGHLRVGEPGFVDYYRDLLPLLPAGSLAEARVLFSYGTALLHSAGDFARAEELVTRSYELAARLGEVLLQKSCLAALAVLDGTSGQLERAQGRIDRALKIAQGHPDPAGDANAWLVASRTMRAAGRLGEAKHYIVRAMYHARLLGDRGALGDTGGELAGIEMMEGQWGDARRAIEAGLGADPHHLLLLARGCLLEYTVGDFCAGDRYRDRILSIHERTRAGPFHAHLHAVSTAAFRALSSGEPRELPRWIPMLRSTASYVDAHPVVRLRAHLLLALSGALLGDRALAREQFRLLAAYPAPHLVRPYLLDRHLGLAAHCYGEHRTAVRHLRAARRQAAAYGDRPAEAWISCELAEALFPSRPGFEVPEEARRTLLCALRSARALAMVPLEERAAKRLQRISETDEAAPPLDFHLSRREREVLSLVDEGLCNDTIAARLAISSNTVANHLRNIMAKTRTRNRTEAAHFARGLGIVN